MCETAEAGLLFEALKVRHQEVLVLNFLLGPQGKETSSCPLLFLGSLLLLLSILDV